MLEATSLGDCADAAAVLAAWPDSAKWIALLASSQAGIHLATRILLALPWIGSYPRLVAVLRVLSILGLNPALKPADKEEKKNAQRPIESPP